MALLSRVVRSSQTRFLSTSVEIQSRFLPQFINKRKLPNVAVLNLRGMIKADDNQRKFGSKNLNFANIDKSIDKAFSLKRLKAIYLIINSPGGSPVQSELISDKIIRLSKQKNVNVVSFVEDLAASGGYWLACAGKEIYVCRNSWVGSIGVVVARFGLNDLIERYGVDWRVYTAGKNKSFLDPFKPEDKEEIKKLQTCLDLTHNNFINYVKQQRGFRLRGSNDELFNGDLWVGQQAVELGLVDGINHLNSYIEEKHGEVGKEVNIVNVNNHGAGFFSLFGGQSVTDIQDMLTSQKYTMI